MLFEEIDVLGGGQGIIGHGPLLLGADAAGGQLAIESGDVLGGGGIPAHGVVALAQGVAGPTGPIGGAGPALRGGDPLIHAGEMLQGHFAVVQEAQGDPAGQPLGLGIARAFGLAVVAGDLIGLLGMAQRQLLAGHDCAFGPPHLGMDLVARGMVEQGHGLIVHVMAAAIAQKLVDQAGIVLQTLGHAGGDGLGVGGIIGQGHASLGHQPVVGIGPQDLMLDGRVLMLPQQAVQAGHLIFVAQKLFEAGQKLALLDRAEIAADPGVAHHLGRLVPLIRRLQGLGIGHGAIDGQGRIDLEPVAHRLIGGGGGDGFLGPLHQGHALRPSRIGADEVGDLGEIGPGIGGDIGHPGDDLGQKLVVSPGGGVVGRGKLLVMGGLEGGPIDPLVLGRQQIGVRRSAAQSEGED